MAIEGIRWRTTPPLGSRPTNRSGAAFSVSADQAAGTAAATTGASEPASLGAVLTLQEMGAETVEDREARKHGQNMLALLAALQRGLLTGVDNVAALQQLAEQAAAVPIAADPRLSATISAILIRVRVELARRHI
jgi:hypothetical protein